MDTAERTDLVRYWFEFDLAGHEPPPTSGVWLDGGTYAYRLLGRGAGVTGYGESDCLRIIDEALGEEDELPAVLRVQPDVDVSALSISAKEIGVTAWRGIWFPPLNRREPFC